METDSTMSNFGRKVTLGAVAFAMVGSTVFGGAALANGKDHKDHKDGKKDVTVTNTGGAGGPGGQSQAQCLIPIGASVGALIGVGGPVSQCNSTGGAGGAGGAGAVLGG
jgi:hypothetical protein